MAPRKFYLLGKEPSTGKYVDVDASLDLTSLRYLVAELFGVVEPSGIDFQTEETELSDVSDVLSWEGDVAVTVDGHKVRDVPGPQGLPIAGNYYEIFPDHLGNHERLYAKYGPIIKQNSLGRVTYETNDPRLATIALTESPFFSKIINASHPLSELKTPEAGIFLGDTDTEEWRLAHKFLPPAFGPKAVRHYAATMQATVEDSFKVFDELDQQGEAFNVYQYMLKLGSQAVGKLVLGMDFHHFDSLDAPTHEMIKLIVEALTLNKKVTSKGTWYGSLPFGDPQRLRQVKQRIYELLQQSIDAAESGGTEDLPLQDAALEAANTVDYLVRAVDNKGEKLPKHIMVPVCIVATGAGFTTTSSLLSWLIYGLVEYEGTQDRMLQELVDHDFNDDTQVTPDLTAKLTYLEKFIKETQRRHNPAYQPGRTAKKDCILPGGYFIPKDSVIISAIHHIHNNPKLWDNPARFNPDRWDSDEVKNMQRNQYIPFCTGGRMCIAYNFALQEVRTMLPKLVWRYKFVKEGESSVEYDPFFQLIRPINLYARATRRVKWPPKSEIADVPVVAPESINAQSAVAVS
ncbi:cytochrome P450 [Thozetella sp. PMI_491]|nr:cytochrome P450 [Thozetella sp. PMI_491]